MEQPFQPETQQFINLVLAEDFTRAEELLKEHPEIICDRNISGETPLHWLAIENRIAGVRLLLEHGSDPNSADYSGESVLHSAASVGNRETIAKLLSAGVHVDTTHPQSGETALHGAARSSRDPAVIDQLVDAGANANSMDNLEWTPLHAAAMLRNIATAERLLERGANASQIGGFGERPLDMVTGSERAAWEALFERFASGDKADD